MLCVLIIRVLGNKLKKIFWLINNDLVWMIKLLLLSKICFGSRCEFTYSISIIFYDFRGFIRFWVIVFGRDIASFFSSFVWGWCIIIFIFVIIVFFITNSSFFLIFSASSFWVISFFLFFSFRRIFCSVFVRVYFCS